MSTQIRHPIFARCYERFAEAMEDRGLGELRDALVAGLFGRVVEVGAGNGMMFRHYPPAVEHVLAVEPEPRLRAAAERAAAEAPVPVTVVAGIAEDLPLPDASVDAAVCSLVLCSVRSQPAALAQLRRVLRPGGELRFTEHVASTRSGGRALQRVADVVWPLFTGGCHVTRDTVGAIEAAGFEVTELRRFRFPDSALAGPAGPHAAGVARRP